MLRFDLDPRDLAEGGWHRGDHVVVTGVGERVSTVGDVHDLPGRVKPGLSCKAGEARDARVIVGIELPADRVMVGVENHRHARALANVQDFAGAVAVLIVLERQAQSDLIRQLCNRFNKLFGAAGLAAVDVECAPG